MYVMIPQPELTSTDKGFKAMGIFVICLVVATIIANLVFTILQEIKGAASKVKHLLLRMRECQTVVSRKTMS